MKAGQAKNVFPALVPKERKKSGDLGGKRGFAAHGPAFRLEYRHPARCGMGFENATLPLDGRLTGDFRRGTRIIL
jgi:hypothetical protein